jgi:3-hydroxymyristoyl/3-hydroxydecanoyl-(acyl carrier protein) dehydratase
MPSNKSQTERSSQPKSFDARAIQRILPHRFPMLLLDRIQVLSLTEASGYKNISANEPWFSETVSSFPETLLIEAMAQLGGLLAVGPANYLSRMAYLSGIVTARFTGKAIPGDLLELIAMVVNLRRTAAVVTVTAQVRAETICFAKLTYAMFDIVPDQSTPSSVKPMTKSKVSSK